MELAKAYDPKEAEESHYQFWETSGFFAPEINEDPDAEPYSIVIPPPNVTGSLHMGHALQHTLMDVLTRWKRMQGYRTLFLVGVDHAGISTQLMVTRQLKKEEHKTPQDIGREAFTRKVWEWKQKYGGEITRQIRREGLSVDWSRERFTMDESLSKAVREVFVRLYEEGWIYRGTRIVNWCPRDKTVLSDLEVKEEKAKDGRLYYLRYPVIVAEARASARAKSDAEIGSEPPAVAGGLTITVATTRPETMLGDTAVAVNPDDERYKHLIGLTIALPLTNREIPIIADQYVESEFGTGAVKITPAHDANDWEIGERHGLEKLVVMNDNATMNENAGPEFNGLDRFEARAKVIEKFEELGLLEKVEDYDVTLPHCERCKTIIEPLLSEQWFVKMDEMRDLALGLMREKGLPHFFPEVPHKKVYTTWLENLKDWTISRQLWWGHQIPAWYDDKGNIYVAHTAEEAYEQAGTSDLRQDEDVLDTWFSSALWPFSTLGWTGEFDGTGRNATVKERASIQPDGTLVHTRVSARSDLDIFYPTDVLVTGRDIIFLWVSRMVMTGLKFIGERPFDDVVVHGTVLDKNGQRMSKTKGNGIDPLDVFEKYGVDATRMTLAGSATGVDFAWRDERVESFRNFANKIWNATRFCLMNSEGATTGRNATVRERASSRLENTLADRWIVSRLNKTAKAVNFALETYQFHEAVQLLYHFFWDDFCDWYIELVKDEITGSVLSNAEITGGNASVNERASSQAGGTLPNGRVSARNRILTVLEQALRMLHPFMPYLTEELWQKLPGVSNDFHNEAYKNAGATIMLTDFPKGDDSMIDEQAETEIQLIIAVISIVRRIRATYQIKPSERFPIIIAGGYIAELRDLYSRAASQITKLAGISKIQFQEEFRREGDLKYIRSVIPDSGGAEIAILRDDIIDVDRERKRLATQLEKLTEEDERIEKQLSNVSFVERAPEEKVQELQERLMELETQIETVRISLDELE